MSPGVAKETARWSGIAVTGGVTLFVLYGCLEALFDGWFRPENNSLSGTLVAVWICVMMGVPSVLIACSLLKRDYFSAVNMLTVVATVLVYFTCDQIERSTGIHKWMFDLDARPRGFWKELYIFFPSHLLLAWMTYRLGCQWARRYLSSVCLPRSALLPRSSKAGRSAMT